MSAVKVLTVREASRRLRRPRPHIAVLLAAGKLTEAAINDRQAVLEDAAFRRMQRTAQKEAA